VLRGRVQGVFFRQSTRDLARELGLSGWVRNRVDGSVEAAFEGPSEPVARMVEWCRRGPPGAQVETVEVHEEQPERLQSRFHVRETA
jgi:acylphosphatase